MYAESCQLLRKLFPYAVFAMIGEMVVQVVKEVTGIGAGLIFVSVLIWAYLAYHAHASILLPEPRERRADNRRVLGFALRTFGLGCLMMIIIISSIVFVLIPAAGGTSDIDAFALVGVGLVCAVAFIVIFGLLGPLLPAYVADRGRGFGAALSLGSSQFLWITGRFIAGPILLYGIAFVLVVAGSYYLEPNVDLLDADRRPNIPLFALLTVAYLVQALATVMVAWVLSTAFKRAEGFAQTDA